VGVWCSIWQAERFFTDSLDEWREKMGIEKMTLIGHSLGGYIVAAYALKYPVSFGIPGRGHVQVVVVAEYNADAQG
jgi:pimeloyl-ACP methyl ester carboxylesterase